MTQVIVAGAGMAGLLAGNMLAHRRAHVYELQEQLPNNHSAVLRFRSPVVGDVLAIPFKSVQMIKTALDWRNPVADALAYSFKNTRLYRSDRSITAGMAVSERFIAPPGLIERMAEPLLSAGLLHFGAGIRFDDPRNVYVSTLPMPALMRFLNYPAIPEFRSVGGVNLHASVLGCDAYVSLLVPDPSMPFSRISLTGDQLIVEAPGLEWPGDEDRWLSEAKELLHQAAALLGIQPPWIYNHGWKRQPYAKILPIDEDVRKDFIYWATDKHNVFSLGRYATWRPGLLLDDLVKDIRLIDGWIDRRNRYAAARVR